MIICEGPDGSGKTTLAQAIAGKFSLQYRRPPVELLSSTDGPGDGIGLYKWWLEQLILPTEERDLGVYDRCFFLSEPIYQMAQVDRDLIVSGEVLARGILDLWSEGPMIIFCMPPFDVQFSAVIQDGRASLRGVQNKHLEKVDFMYWAFWAMWMNGLFEAVVQYDYTRNSQDYIFERVEAFLGSVTTSA